MIFKPSLEQRHAIEFGKSLEPVFSTTGPAGTGKTALMDEMFHKVSDRGLRVAVCSPTGKATKNIMERTSIITAVTAHRLLEFPLPEEIAADKKNGKPTLVGKQPKRNSSNPLEYDVVFADEYSMINWELHGQLVDALPDHAIIRPFGDIRQLKPVEKGSDRDRESPFAYLLKNHPSVHLQKSWRSGDSIIGNANRILNGQVPISNDDFFLITENDVLKTLEEWIDAHRGFGIDYLGDPNCQIITPSNKTSIGTVDLNLFFLKKKRAENPSGWFHPPRHYWDKGSDVMFRVGVKVLQTKNDYNTGVMNGETGTLIERTPEGDIMVDFGDRVVKYPYEFVYLTPEGFERTLHPQADLELGWVLTTHKCQGSQFKHVIYVMNYEARYTHRISNFYTGVTRTQETCAVITDQRALYNSLSND